MSQDSKKLVASSPSLLFRESSGERGLGGEVPAEGEVHADTTNWRAWYWAVLGALAVEVAFFAYLTRAFTV